jgi:hypothetical protein
MDVNVLVVGAGDRVARWTRWLEGAGWNAFVCAGPELAWECPRIHGERCARRELADVAVITPDGQPDDAERICTRLPDDGTTITVTEAEIPFGQGVSIPHPSPGPLVDAVRAALLARTPATGP